MASVTGSVGAAANKKAPALVKAKQSKPRQAFRVRLSQKFLSQSEGVTIDSLLMLRTQALCYFLIDESLVSGDIVYNSGVRGPKTAHLWSTAFNIRQRRIPLKNLTDLKDGKDLDGNLWYDPAWEDGLARGKDGKLTKAADSALWQKIVANAESYWKGKIAAEGYSTDDPRIKPNVHKTKSNHVDGNAVDISISWRAGAKVPPEFGGRPITNGETSDSAANAVVAAFGLCRPVKSEKWHFQLDRNALKEISRDCFDYYVA
jgi:hypothetical protein